MTEWRGTVVATTDRLTLRTFREDDLPLYAALNVDPEVVEYLGGALSREDSDDIAAYANDLHASDGIGLLAVERTADGQFMGMCGVHVLDWYPDDLEVGYRFARAYWGQGYATEAARAWLRIAFEQCRRPARHLGHRRPERAQHRGDAAPRPDVRPCRPARGGRHDVRRRHLLLDPRPVARADRRSRHMTVPTDRGPTALVRRPGPRLVEGLITHIEREPVDVALALQQWEAYVAALRDADWEIVEVPPADDCPDAVFIEDPVVVFGTLAVLCRSGAPSRRPETAALGPVLEGLGYRVERIVEPGTIDGGDVLKVGATVYVGLTDRTNAEGIRQLAGLVGPAGFDVVAVPTTKVLHLKSAVTALPDGTVIGFPPLVDDPTAFAAFLPVPEEPGSHVVLLGEGRLLISSAAPRTAELLADLGHTPVPVDVSEFEKLEGCVTCLSVRLRP